MQIVQDFVNKIPHNSKIAIWGACECGVNLKNYINQNRKDIKILFWVDSLKTGEYEGLDIITPVVLHENIEKIDLILVATRSGLHELDILFSYLNYPYIVVPSSVEQYYRRGESAEHIDEVMQILETDDDRNVYRMVWDYLLGFDSLKIKNYAFQEHQISEFAPLRNYNKHYMEFINKDEIKTVIDGGVCNGIQFFAYKKYFKNLEKIYGFEPMYEKFKTELCDYHIQKMPEVCIVPLGLWEKQKELAFVETKQSSASYVQEIKTTRPISQFDKVCTVKTISIDKFVIENNIKKIDFVKMDIEGSELPALKGALNTIKRDRPQLAISIYHSPSDMINIPMFLHENLEGYSFHIGHYSYNWCETLLYAIPKELEK